MTYLGLSTYSATQAEIDALPSWHEAGNRPALGMYRTVSASTHGPAIVEVVKDPIQGTREVYSRIKIQPPVRDQIITKLDEENQFSKY